MVRPEQPPAKSLSRTADVHSPAPAPVPLWECHSKWHATTLPATPGRQPAAEVLPVLCVTDHAPEPSQSASQPGKSGTDRLNRISDQPTANAAPDHHQQENAATAQNRADPAIPELNASDARLTALYPGQSCQG